jgi:hypothetical protein
MHLHLWLADRNAHASDAVMLIPLSSPSSGHDVAVTKSGARVCRDSPGGSLG